MSQNVQGPAAQASGSADAAPNSIQPRTDRVQVIDTLRGFALLGILIMNMVLFANPDITYYNPSVPYGRYAGIEKWIWHLSFIFADQKMMTIFSPLYGAGILMLATRTEARGRNPAALFYRRSLWLLCFGAIHFFFIWSGDILLLYSITGMVVYLLRNRAPSTLLALGLVLIAVHAVQSLNYGWNVGQMSPEEQRAEIQSTFDHSAEDIAQDLAGYRGTWMEVLRYRWQTLDVWIYDYWVFWGIWRASGLMLIGMAAWKWRVFTAERSNRFYGRLILVGLVGLTVVSLGLWDMVRTDWDFFHAYVGPGYQAHYWGGLLVSTGYVGLVMLAERKGWLSGLRARLSAVGRMALTNYLTHSLVCTTLVYGYGFGLYGRLSRLEQMGIIALIWAFQLLVSPLWLARFRFGPMEWLWRSLAYGRFLPIRR